MASDPPYIDEPPGTPVPPPAPNPRPADTHLPEIRAPRTLQQKVFDIPWTGWLELSLASLVVGVLLNLAQIDFTTPGFTLGRALGQLVQGIFRGLGWLVSTGWWPLLSGVLVVMPLWLAWRAVSALWRK